MKKVGVQFNVPVDDVEKYRSMHYGKQRSHKKKEKRKKHRVNCPENTTADLQTLNALRV